MCAPYQYQIVTIMNYFVSTNEDNVMIFSEKPFELRTIAEWITMCGIDANEVYEVKDEECQYYIYSPVWVTDDEKRNNVLTKVNKWRESQTKEQLDAIYKKLCV